jgi:PKD repeat protein
MIPTASNYPNAFDTNRNLFLVHDSLRVTLAEDYSPGDTKIVVYPDDVTMLKFPPSGIITLTEQCSNPEERAISFFYNTRDLTGFQGLELITGFTDTAKPKNITHVTQNVMAAHHNHLKNSLIAIENFVGIKDTVDDKPFGETMEGRINFLRRLVLSPKAWFSVNKTVGLVPLSVEFKDLSFRLGTGDCGTGPIIYEWDFGDNTASNISIIEVSDEVPSSVTNVIVHDTDGKTIRKTYSSPGIYDVKLTVTNDFGSDTVILPSLINARITAPDEAIIEYVPRTGQILTPGEPDGGPFTSPPVIRAVMNSLIDIQIRSGVNPTTGRTYGGEMVDGNDRPIDPIVSYTWDLPDDQIHSNSNRTRAVFGVGGIYDLIMRADTQFGAYRITSYESSLDIIEKANMWLWTFTDSDTVRAYEFGLLSETFKIKSGTEVSLGLDDDFLTGLPSETQQKREFRRNNGFSSIGTQLSGNQGQGVLYWASGRAATDPASEEKIKFLQYTAFTDTYLTKSSISRPWNWVGMGSFNSLYFILGLDTAAISPFQSPTNQTKTTVVLNTLASSSETLTAGNYKNGAEELGNNVANYDGDGLAIDGNFSVYRAAWKDSVGFFLRNDGVGSFFRIKDFYRTEAVGTAEFQNIRKLPGIAGPAKVEGQLVPLSAGLFFFNNTGQISAYNDVSGVWETGGINLNSAQFRSLQNSSVTNFDSESNTLIAASDGDKIAYLSYDYSPKAFIKYNATTSTFSSMSPRPSGEQWQMRVY